MLRQSLRHDICPGAARSTATRRSHHAAARRHTIACGSGHGAGFLFITRPHEQGHRRDADRADRPLRRHPARVEPDDVEPDDGQDQRQIMLVMPLFFVIFIISFPAGVIVYWITTNSGRSSSSTWSRRRIGPVTPSAATAGPRRGWRRTALEARAAGQRRDGVGVGRRRRRRCSGGRVRPPEAERARAGVGAGIERAAEPAAPPSPRKKKKRSGRRR